MGKTYYIPSKYGWKIAQNRKRAQIAAMFAVLFLVGFPLVGSMISDSVNHSQVSLLELDDAIDPATDILLSDALNESDANGSIIFNGVGYSTDIYSLRLGYISNGSLLTYPLSYTTTSDDKLFFIATEDPNHPTDATQTGDRPFVKVFTFITPEELNDYEVSEIKIYYEDGSSEARTFKLFVSYSGGSQLLLDPKTVNVSANGTWVSFNLSELDRLSIASQFANDPSACLIFLVTSYDDSNRIEIGSSIIIDLQVIGSTEPSENRWINIYYLTGGAVGLIGAIFATPFVSVGSVSGFLGRKKSSKKRRPRSKRFSRFKRFNFKKNPRRRY